MRKTHWLSWIRTLAAPMGILIAWQALFLSAGTTAPVFVTPVFAQTSAPKPDDDPLAKIEAKVDRDYKNVRQMTASKLAKLRAAGKQLLIFDVREKAEYNVSRIPGAIRVDPGIWSSTFLRANAGKVKGREVVFYCSVGVRSSRLAARVQKALINNGATGVYNLRGGVFRWHNQKRVLEDAKGKTPYVHPYDRYWGKLVNRSKYTRFKPMPR